jgi:hypothetical protein
MGTGRTATGEQAAAYTLYVYNVHKFEYVLFLILYIFFEFNRTVTTYISYFLHSHFAAKAPLLWSVCGISSCLVMVIW